MSLRYSMRKHIMLVYDYTCQYCNSRKNEANLEVDHIYPRSLGGSDELENLTLACNVCNQRKKDVVLPEPGSSLLFAIAIRKAETIRRRIVKSPRADKSCGKTLKRLVNNGSVLESVYKIVTVDQVTLNYPPLESALSSQIVQYFLEQTLTQDGKYEIDFDKMYTVSRFKNITKDDIDLALSWASRIGVRIGDRKWCTGFFDYSALIANNSDLRAEALDLSYNSTIKNDNHLILSIIEGLQQISLQAALS